jgi:hypothetical protein
LIDANVRKPALGQSRRQKRGKPHKAAVWQRVLSDEDAAEPAKKGLESGPGGRLGEPAAQAFAWPGAAMGAVA